MSARDRWHGKICMPNTRSPGTLSMHWWSCFMWRLHWLSWRCRWGSTGVHVLQNCKYSILLGLFTLRQTMERKNNKETVRRYLCELKIERMSHTVFVVLFLFMFTVFFHFPFSAAFLILLKVNKSEFNCLSLENQPNRMISLWSNLNFCTRTFNDSQSFIDGVYFEQDIIHWRKIILTKFSFFSYRQKLI